MNRTDISAYLKSDRFIRVLAAIGFVIIALVIFDAGVAVGFHKASFAHDWEENYTRNFGAPGSFGLPARGIPNPHGAAGTIVSVDLPTFVIAGPNENEKIIRIDDDTIIRNNAGMMDADDIEAGTFATVIGAPQSGTGEITARLIRIMPEPASTTPSR